MTWGQLKNKDTFHDIIYMEKYGLVQNNQFTNELNKTVYIKLKAACTNSLPTGVCMCAFVCVCVCVCVCV